jgi:hypothetical protein
MSQNLVPIRQFAYIFDRRHFGMIGTVTLRDTRLAWGRELEGQLFEGGEGHKNLEGGACPGCQGNDRWRRPAGDAGALCARVLASQDLSPPFWKPPLAHALGGFSGQTGLAPRTLAFQHHTPVPLPHVK